MVKLEKEFIGIGEVRGFLFEQIHKSKYAYMYRVSSGGEEKDKPKVWYEVFERKVSKEIDTCIGGQKVHFEEREIYPKANSFGISAWTIIDLIKAKEVFETITLKMKEKEENKLLLT